MSNDADFRDAMAFIFPAEGGEENVVGDRGGLTNMGVTQDTYDRYRRLKNLPPQPVTFLTTVEGTDLYWTLFWMEAACPLLPRALAIFAMDCAVLHGVENSVRFLQLALGVAADGKVGPQTRDAFSRAQASSLRDLTDRRTDFISDDVYEADLAAWDQGKRELSQAKFLKGWMRRVRKLERMLTT